MKYIKIVISIKYVAKAVLLVCSLDLFPRLTALAVKIGEAIKTYNSYELNRVDEISDPKSMWAKVHQLTGRSKSRVIGNPDVKITANMLITITPPSQLMLTTQHQV